MVSVTDITEVSVTDNMESRVNCLEAETMRADD